MYGVYVNLLHGCDVNIQDMYYPCLTSAEYHPKRKKLKGYQKK